MNWGIPLVMPQVSEHIRHGAACPVSLTNSKPRGHGALIEDHQYKESAWDTGCQSNQMQLIDAAVHRSLIDSHVREMAYCHENITPLQL